MCGVSGFWGPRDRALLEAMTAAQVHRGPDDVGFLETDDASLGFRRLSIIDLVSGNQPMSTDDGLVHISYNGEVYNFRELRAELEAAGHEFHTTCDTEVVLHAYAEWGTDCFVRFNGMWGVAFLDLRAESPRVVLARDHFGIKPMYYAQSGDARALRVGDQGDSPGPDVRAARRRPADVRVPRVRPLRPHRGHVLRGRARGSGGRVRDRRRRPVCASSATGSRCCRRPSSRDPADFRAVFDRAVERRLVADVPVGICLSGGLDSSSICTVMAQPTRGPCARLGVTGRPSPDVLRGVPRRPHRRDPLHRQRARASPARPRAGANPPPKTSSARWSRGSGTSRSRWCRARRSPCGW